VRSSKTKNEELHDEKEVHNKHTAKKDQTMTKYIVAAVAENGKKFVYQMIDKLGLSNFFIKETLFLYEVKEVTKENQ
jgi:uncharacterized FAD-dependent dehydrogenase